MKLIGLARLGRDAELRYTPQGDAVANFSVAYNYGKKDTGGNQPAQFVDCALWGKRAESLAPYLLKGKRFYIELSDVHIEEYQGKNGTGTKLSGRVADIEFADAYEDGEKSQRSAPPAQARASGQSYATATGRSMAAQAPAGQFADDGADIPF